MKREELELLFAAGELTEAETKEYLGMLSANELATAELLKGAFADLKQLNEGIPEPQISFARVKDAIQAAPAAKPSWMRWMPFAVAVPAAAALMVIAMNQSTSRIQSPVGETSIPTVAMQSPNTELAPTNSAPKLDEEISVSPEIETGPKTSVVVNSTREPARPTRPSTRRHRPLMASRDSAPMPGIASAGARISGHLSVDDMAALATVAYKSYSKNTQSTGAPIGNAGFGTSGAPESENAVLLTNAPDSETGANEAFEVNVSDDVVIGS